tara:strand:+ start:1016 stop:1123 length:108 start_codon:yes stop_codon:yes gene_type:complete
MIVVETPKGKRTLVYSEWLKRVSWEIKQKNNGNSN